MYRIVYPAADGRLLAARSRVVVGSRSTRPRFPFQSDRSYTLRVRAGKVGDDGKEDKLGEDDKGGEDGGDGSKLGDLFQRELQKRNISSVDDIQEDANRSGSARPDASSSYVPPPQFASGFGPPDEEDDGVGGDQLARSRRIGSEGLDGLIPRGSQLLTLGATSFLAFGPFILFVLLSFGAVYMAFGDFFVHSGTPASGPPVYYDPADLLAEPTADPMIPIGGRLHVGVRRKAMTLSEKASAMLSVEDVSLLFQSGSASPQDDIDKLQATASLLDAQIKSLVLDNRELLLEETARVRGAGKDFQKLLLAVRSLQSVASRVKAEVAEPQAQLASKIRELSNMYSTVAILRQATHQIKLVQRIKAAYDGGDSGDGGAGNGGAGAAGAIRRGAEVDLPKLARLLTDAEQAWEEADLAGIRVCEENQAFVKACKGEVLGRAMALLERGVESRAQADVGGALLALHGLGELGPCLDELLQEMVQRVKKRFMRSLDAKRAAGTAAGGIGGIGGIGGAGQSHRNESQVWEELEKSMEELRESALCAWHLEKVFRKKQDLSGSKLVDLVDEKVRRPFETFWTMSLERMKDCFEAAMVARNRVVRDQLVGQYQRLAGLLDATLSSIVRETMDGRSRAVTDEQAQQYYAAVAGVESVYLNQIQARFESVALTAFPGGSRPLPSQVDLQALNARFFEEMKRAQSGGERIVALTAATLGAVLLTVATQARDMGEVLDIETIAAQERNLALARSVEDLAKNVNLVCSKLLAGSGARPSSFKSATTLSSPATASVKAALALEGPADVLRQTSRELLEPIFRSKTDELRHVIEKMHSMNFAAAQGAESEVAMPSSYVQELNRALEEFGRGVLRVSGASPSGDVHKSVALALLREMCDALIRCWIHHASFVRPLTPPGKLQLAKDAIELEAGLRQLVSRINTTQLQEFKKLLFTETDDMSDVKVTVATLGKTVTLNHLFSRLPEEILSPHRRSRLSQAQYFVWIEDHSDEEALKQIELALVTATDDPVVRLMKCVLQC